ncbi:ABC transporter permease [Catalinimonas niigatensis]|uniref:ABC transporter permease n=1 Tax=Catalinimonas niigatensis TaxID=1397264 RepID=UPI00266522B9|nr:ABC transporter permease [Catalinimonas niigatensis]WPP52347.1 ABC transporter permease [Catalinimonas niigatensis]
MDVKKNNEKDQFSDKRPPHWAERFLNWYCKPELLEDLQGDLNEFFHRNLKSKGIRKAHLIYILDVLKFFRLYTVKKPNIFEFFSQSLMLGSYVKTSTRILAHNKLFSTINILGLASSMSVGLLLLAMLSDLYSYDDFHEKKERIYRINTTDLRDEQRPMQLASTSVRAGKRISESVSGVEDLTLMRRGFGGDAMIEKNTVSIQGFWADQSFFEVFSFPLLEGDSATALKEPYSLVLTEKSATKLFGNAEALGKTVRFDSMDYTVTGIMKDVPQRSHIQFEALGSFSTMVEIKPNTDGDFLAWENIYMSYIYLSLHEGSDPESVQQSLDKLSATENAGLEYRNIQLWLQSLENIPLRAGLSNEIGLAFNRIALWVLIGLAMVIILSACFNYTNLSIARSLRRSREVGIRKVLGALKSQVLAQFITESVILSLLSLVFSFALFLLLRQQFLSLDSFLSSRFLLELTPELICWFIGLAILVGLLAGMLPAVFFSRIHTSQVLKDASSLKVFRHVSMRKALVVVQYTFSLIFIITVIIGYNQYKSFISFDLGFTTENIVNIWLNGTNGDTVEKELAELTEVQGLSRSRMVTSIGSMYGTQMKYRDDSTIVLQNMVDEDYLPLHQHQLLAGRNFNPKAEGADENEVIVNEQLIQYFNLGNQKPEQALGEIVDIDNKQLTIVGVVKDFHYGTLSDKIQPTVFRHVTDKDYGFINVKIQTEDWASTFTAIEKIWKKIEPVHPLQATLYDDQIEQAYRQFVVMVKVIGFIAFLAVCIASMGLFGMVVFTTETRMKEISIRKVLGASEGNLLFLLSRSFLLLLLLSALIAIPTTYLFFDKVVLVNFAYHQPIQIGELLVGVLILMLLACLMVGSQTLKVAQSNPAEVLKNE